MAMTIAQLDAVQALVNDDLNNARVISPTSGKNYTVGPKGRYTVARDDTTQLLTFTPKEVTKASYDRNDIMVMPYSEIEQIGIPGPNTTAAE